MKGVIGARTAMAGHADDHRGAPRRDGVDDLQRGRLAADRIEGVVDAAARRSGCARA